MLWNVVRAGGFPAVSLDARFVAYWVGNASVASPIPYYGREVVVGEVDEDGDRDRIFRLLGQAEVARSLPRGESPTPRALRLSRERLRDLETRVQERVSLANAWLDARPWAPMSVCKSDGSANAARIGALRVSLTPLAVSGRIAIAIHHVDGTLLARSEEELACGGEARLVSVAVAKGPNVAVVEVASTSSDSCSAPNRVRAYRLGRGDAPAQPALEAHGCELGRALTETERASLLLPYERSDLAVIRVSPADPLNLRGGPGVRAPIVARLPFLFDGLRHTGGACQVEGALWLEVEHGGRRGWVNERFVSPTAAFEDVEAIAEAAVTSFAAPTLAALGRSLRRAITREQSALAGAALDVELVGYRERAGYGQLALFLTPIGGDSISGTEYIAHAILEAGRWRLEALEQRFICSRGSFDGLCV